MLHKRFQHDRYSQISVTFVREGAFVSLLALGFACVANPVYAKQVDAEACAVTKEEMQGAAKTGLLRVPDVREALQMVIDYACAEETNDAAPPRPPPAKPPPAPSPKPEPVCTETPSFNDKTLPPITVHADSASEFFRKITQAMGGGYQHFTSDDAYNLDFDEKGKVVTVNFELKTAIALVRYGGGRPPPNELVLIKKIEQMSKDHEDRHRSIARTVIAAAVCAAVGKSTAAAEKILKKAMCETEPDAQAALDAQEGAFEWVIDGKGNVIDVKYGGAKQNYRICTGS